MFDKQDAHGDQDQHEQLRRRPRRTRARPEQHDRTNCARWSPTRSRCCTTSPRRRPGCASSSSRSTASPRRRRPVAEHATPNCFIDLDTFFTAWASVAPLARRGDRRRAAVAANRRSTRCRTRRRSTKTRPSSCACCAPARSSLRHRRAAARRTPSRSAPSTSRAATALNTRARRILHRRSRNSAQNPVVHLGARRLHADARSRQPAARRARARADQLQLLDARVPQPREPRSPRTSASARSRAPASCSRRPDRTTRASRPPPRPTGRPIEHAVRQHRRSSTTTTCTPTPTRTSPAPASRSVCEAGNETYIPGKAVIGNVPAARRRQQPRNHDPRTEPVRRKVPGSRRSRPSACDRRTDDEQQVQGKGKQQMSPRALVAPPRRDAGRRAAAREPRALRRSCCSS